MSKDNQQKTFNQLSDLKNLFTEDELSDKKHQEDKSKYQEEWKRNTNGHRKMVAKKTGDG